MNFKQFDDEKVTERKTSSVQKKKKKFYSNTARFYQCGLNFNIDPTYSSSFFNS